MEWVIAGAALLIIAAFVVATARSARAPRPQPRDDRRDDGTGAAVATGVIVAGAIATDPESDQNVDPADGGGGWDGGGGGDAGASGGGWGGGDGGGGGGGDGGGSTA
ncbi:MAG: hypothetical protein ACXWWL_00020 [Candidatus Limnocylindria bacterium]